METRDENGRFLPGTAHSPGRPKKGQALTDLLREAGALAEADGVSKNDKLTDMLWAKALEGDMAAIKYIYDRIDGQPVSTQNITADIETSVSHNLEALTTDELKTLAAIIAKT
jgi:hypothetical protein